MKLKTEFLIVLVVFFSSLLISLFSPSSFANDLSLSFGPSLDGGYIGQKKALQLSYEFRWAEPSLQLEVGAWPDSGALTGMAGANLGVHVTTPDGLTARIGFGPSYITQTDDRLSSLFEFHIQAKAGLEFTGWAVGLQLDHFSNAGIVPPNLGMDLASLYISIPVY